MTWQDILTHLAAAFAGGGAILVWLRKIEGWLTPFEAEIKARFAQIEATIAAPAPGRPTPSDTPTSSPNAPTPEQVKAMLAAGLWPQHVPPGGTAHSP